MRSQPSSIPTLSALLAGIVLSLPLMSIGVHAQVQNLAKTSSDTKTYQLEVVEVDDARGILTVMDARGVPSKIKFNSQAKRFDLKPGTRLTATTSSSMVVDLVPPGDLRKPREAVFLSEPLPNTSAPTTMVSEKNTRYIVASVDAQTNEVGLRSRDGVRTVRIDNPALRSKLALLKAGDIVDVTLSETLTVQVQ